MSVLTRIADFVDPARSQGVISQNLAYLNLFNTFMFNGVTYPIGMTQTLTGDRETIDRSFAAIVEQAYQGNGTVFACELARFMLFSEARFQFRRMRSGRPAELYGTQDLAILEDPWPGGVTGDLLTSALLDADLAGNAFIARRDSDRGRLVRLRPDWIEIVLGSQDGRPADIWDIDAEPLGYVYYPGGKFSGRDPEFLQRTEVAHFAPVKDPLAMFRGMSWLTPVLREIASDTAATNHKLKYFENGATPNMVVSLDKDVPPQKFADFVKLFKEKEPVGLDVYKTLYLGGGADAKVVGGSLQQIDFKVVQGAGETRIASAAGVPSVIAGFSEGLAGSSLNAGNYSSARRRFVDGTIRPLWRNFAGSMQTIVPPPPGSILWYDDRDIAFLREDAKDRADIQSVEAQSIRTLIDAGYVAESIIAAIQGEDWSLLKHSGLFSVQLQAPGATKMPEGEAPGELPVGGGTKPITAGQIVKALLPATTNGAA
jgi:hypothetical protein